MTAVLAAAFLACVVRALLEDRAGRADVALLIAQFEREAARLHATWARPAAAAIRRRTTTRPRLTLTIAPWPAPETERPVWHAVATYLHARSAA